MRLVYVGIIIIYITNINCFSNNNTVEHIINNTIVENKTNAEINENDSYKSDKDVTHDSESIKDVTEDKKQHKDVIYKGQTNQDNIDQPGVIVDDKIQEKDLKSQVRRKQNDDFREPDELNFNNHDIISEKRRGYNLDLSDEKYIQFAPGDSKYFGFRINDDVIGRRALRNIGLRRALVHKEEWNKQIPNSNTDDLGETSTSKELKDWKANFQAKWQNKKADAIRSPLINQTSGLILNMGAARPWRVPCGDQNAQDVPYGTCTMEYECEAEYRIFRGDVQCRAISHFICCAIQDTEIDMYQALDASFMDTSSASTSSLEELKQHKGSREVKRRKERRHRYRVLKAKYRRKRKIKRTIRRLEKAIRKELNRAFRNSSQLRHVTTRNLKALIIKLKKKLKQDRFAAKNQHDLDLKHIDGKLQAKLDKIRALNHHFLMNDTFREIILYGAVSAKGARMLVEAYPELEPDLRDFSSSALAARRSGGAPVPLEELNQKPKDYLDYDIEIGVLDG